MSIYSLICRLILLYSLPYLKNASLTKGQVDLLSRIQSYISCKSTKSSSRDIIVLPHTSVTHARAVFLLEFITITIAYRHNKYTYLFLT